MWITLGLFVVLVALYLFAGYYFARFCIFPIKRDYDMVKSEEITYFNVKSPAAFDDPGEELTMRSADGLKLVAHYFKPEINTGRYVLFNHGYNYPYGGVYKYLPLFLQQGIGVLAPDHRGCGKSDSAPITFGYYEHRDSIAWLGELKTIAKKEGSESPKIGVMGESLGAATSLLMAAKQPLLDFCIADCSYTSWKDIIKCRCKFDFKNRVNIFLPSAYLFIHILTGARLKEVDIIKAANQIKIPTLIIHGDADSYVPYEMGQRIAAANDSFIFYTQPGAKHAQSVTKNFETYKNTVDTFLKQIHFIRESSVMK